MLREQLDNDHTAAVQLPLNVKCPMSSQYPPLTPLLSSSPSAALSRCPFSAVSKSSATLISPSYRRHKLPGIVPLPKLWIATELPPLSPVTTPLSPLIPAPLSPLIPAPFHPPPAPLCRWAPIHFVPALLRRPNLFFTKSALRSQNRIILIFPSDAALLTDAAANDALLQTPPKYSSPVLLLYPAPSVYPLPSLLTHCVCFVSGADLLSGVSIHETTNKAPPAPALLFWRYCCSQRRQKRISWIAISAPIHSLPASFHRLQRQPIQNGLQLRRRQVSLSHSAWGSQTN